MPKTSRTPPLRLTLELCVGKPVKIHVRNGKPGQADAVYQIAVAAARLSGPLLDLLTQAA
jgi:hypothetical protein